MPGQQALDGKRQTDFEVAPDDLYVETNPSDPLFDPRSTMPVTEAIVEMFLGGHQTCDVVAFKNGSRVQVIDGHQKLAAVKEANRRLKAQRQPPLPVRVTLKKFASTADAVIFAKRANRRVASTPSVLAREVFQLAEINKIPHVQIAREMGLESALSCKPLIALAQLCPEAHAAVDAGRISMSRAIARLKDVPLSEQPGALEVVLADAGPTKRAPVLKAGRPSVETQRRIYAKGREAEEAGTLRGTAVAWLRGVGFAIGAVDVSAAAEEIPGVAELFEAENA